MLDISAAGEQIVLLYFIQNVPFTFDELPEIYWVLPRIIRLIKDEKMDTRRNVQIFKLSYDGRMSPNAV